MGHNGQVLHRKAYGNRAILPSPEPMTADTIFDCASLTKVVATTSALMKLFEEGKLRLNDRVTQVSARISRAVRVKSPSGI